jgi:FixJ family two-component response regulator
MPQAMKLIAIVEDDAAMRKSIDRLLRAHGYATAKFASAEEFLDSGATEGVFGLVLDIHLSGMSGIDLRRRLLAAESKIRVVFMTAFDDEPTRAAALTAGCVAYLQKPFDASQLMDALERGTGS